MDDIRSRFEVKHGWWIETRCPIPNALPKDGLLVVFRRADIEPLMDQHYPHGKVGGKKIWWFNSTKDREIAELDYDDRVYCNPQVLWTHFI